MSETLGPETLVRILNGYFEAACKAVTHHGGHIANFLGDGIMAIFGAPENNPWQSLDAVIAALSMRKAIQRYNEDLARQSLPTLDVRIGIHKGTVVAGVVGSTENLEYTVIGDVVNTAARIENLTRKHGVDILISAEVRPALDGRFEVRDLPPEQVKGRRSRSLPLLWKDFAANSGTSTERSGVAKARSDFRCLTKSSPRIADRPAGAIAFLRDRFGN